MFEQRRIKLFRNGRYQAVWIPMEFELPGDEAISRRQATKPDTVQDRLSGR